MFARAHHIPSRARLTAIVLLAIFASASPCLAERMITDMAGRAVSIPDKVTRVGTIGPVPVLNSFVFAIGAADTIVNNLPPRLSGPRWHFQYVVAPELARRPVIQTGQGPNIEGVVEASPDLVLTMDKPTIDVVERAHIPVLYLSWQKPEDVKTVMRLLGDVYDRKEAAESYDRYFDATIEKVRQRTGALPDAERPRVLYADFKRLTQPHKIAEWWIGKAGGRSVTDDGRIGEAFNFSLEQVLLWNPEVLIVTSDRDIAAIYGDKRLDNVAAVKNKRVYAIPMGVHVWGNRTVEQPLTVLWAAKIIHPELFADMTMEDEVRSFYAKFFKTELSDEDLRVILEGRAGEPR